MELQLVLAAVLALDSDSVDAMQDFLEVTVKSKIANAARSSTIHVKVLR
jgi:hypothetical protein